MLHPDVLGCFLINTLTDFVNFKKSLYLSPTLQVRLQYPDQDRGLDLTNQTEAGRNPGNHSTGTCRKVIK
jgi:hypothetical protein